MTLSPLPWRYDSYEGIVVANGTSLDGGLLDEPDAALIIHRVNTWEALLEAAKELRSLLDTIGTRIGEDYRTASQYRAAVAAIRAATEGSES